MLVVAEALAPIFLLVIIGLVLARTGIVPAGQWQGVERVFYYVLFPSLIIDSIVRADLSSAPVVTFTAVMLAALIVMTVLLVALRPLVLRRWGESGPAFASLFQGAIRWNSFGALAIVAALHQRPALSLAAVAFAAIIPYVNVASVVVHTVDGANAERANLRAVAVALLANPLIWSPAIGIAVAVSGLPVPKVIGETLRLLAQPTVALGLLIVGAGLDWRAALKPTRIVLLASALKLVVMPALMVGIGYAAGLRDGASLGVLAICGSIQTASAAYVLARRMGGDDDLMARIIATETLLAFLTMPVVIWLAAQVAG